MLTLKRLIFDWSTKEPEFNLAAGYYSSNRLTRGKITEFAIHTALIPLINPGDYFPEE